MKKLAKALRALRALIKNPWLLNHVLSDERVWTDYLRRHNYPLNGLPVVEWDDLFRPGFQETVEPFAFLDGGSLPVDIALLKGLARRFSACNYFEIGTWRGESAANVASVASQCYTLNLSEKEMLEKGMSKEYTGLHGFFSQKKKNITHLQGNSLTFDFAALQKKFDLIFIDGDHHFDVVKNDTEKVFAHLVHEHSIVVWHDYAYHPEKVRPEVLAALWEGTPVEKRNRLVHVAHTLCAVYLPEKVKTHHFHAPVRPGIQFKIDLTTRSI
jgi:predicted O-methyltransferase YrrM